MYKVHHRELLIPLARSLQVFPQYAANTVGCDIAVVSGQRLEEQQRRLWMKGRYVSSGICVCAHHPLGKAVTNAKHADETAHGRCLALDYCPVENGHYLWDDEKGISQDERHRRVKLFSDIGELAEKSGFVWGGRWADPVDLGHIEVAGWKDLPYRKGQDDGH